MTLPFKRVFGQNLAIFAQFWAFSATFLVITAINMLTLGIGCTCIFYGHIPSWFEAVLAIAMLQFWTRGPQKWVILGQNQVTMAGSVWDWDSSWKPFITSNHINTKRKTWFRAVFTPAIPPPCAKVWSKMAVVVVKIKLQWQGQPGTLESSWKRFKSRLYQWENMIQGCFGPCHPSCMCTEGWVKNGRFWRGPWVTLPLLPKISHFWPPRAHGRRMAKVKATLNLLLLT